VSFTVSVVLRPFEDAGRERLLAGRERLLWVRRAFVPFRDVFERGRERVCEEREFAERPFAERVVEAFAERVVEAFEVEALDDPPRGVRAFAWAIVTASLCRILCTATERLPKVPCW
jgi:hypothetical protein